jgi:hypothetical protein
MTGLEMDELFSSLRKRSSRMCICFAWWSYRRNPVPQNVDRAGGLVGRHRERELPPTDTGHQTLTQLWGDRTAFMLAVRFWIAH